MVQVTTMTSRTKMLTLTKAEVFYKTHCSDLYLPSVHLSKVQKGVYHSGIKVFNCMPPRIKSLSSDMRKFKSASKKFLFEGSFYTIQEYFDWNLLNNPSTGNLPVINDC